MDFHLAGKQKRAIAGIGKRKTSSRCSDSTSSPLGMLALHLLAQWNKTPRAGIVFLAEGESRTERIGSLPHSLDGSLGVLVSPRLNTLPLTTSSRPGKLPAGAAEGCAVSPRPRGPYS